MRQKPLRIGKPNLVIEARGVFIDGEKRLLCGLSHYWQDRDNLLPANLSYLAMLFFLNELEQKFKKLDGVVYSLFTPLEAEKLLRMEDKDVKSFITKFSPFFTDSLFVNDLKFSGQERHFSQNTPMSFIGEERKVKLSVKFPEDMPGDGEPAFISGMPFSSNIDFQEDIFRLGLGKCGLFVSKDFTPTPGFFMLNESMFPVSRNKKPGTTGTRKVACSQSSSPSEFFFPYVRTHNKNQKLGVMETIYLNRKISDELCLLFEIILDDLGVFYKIATKISDGLYRLDLEFNSFLSESVSQIFLRMEQALHQN